MENKKYVIAGIVLFFAIGFAYSQYRADKIAPKLPDKATTEQDGEFYVTVSGIDAQNMILRLKHITYFTGQEAFSSAEHEVKCGGGDITDCVPTLKNGYYVRESGAPEFSATISKETKILLSAGKPDSATLDDLNKEIALPTYEPVFKVTVKNGTAVFIEEITRYREDISGGLPKGYVLDDYQVEKILDVACKSDEECETPAEYLLLSNCPYTSICRQNKCTVICPDSK